MRWSAGPQPAPRRCPCRAGCRSPSTLLARFPPHRLPDLLHRQRADVEKCEDPAGTGLAALELPRERPDDAPRVQDLLDVAPDVLGVDAPFREGEIVHRKDLFLHEAPALVVTVLVLAEEVAHGLADLLLEAMGWVRRHVADGGVHGVIARARVDAPPRDLRVVDPQGHVPR